jgi:hypothetical protein
MTSFGALIAFALLALTWFAMRDMDPRARRRSRR